MALKKTIDFRGIPVTDAYIRIDTATINSGNERIDFIVHYMASGDSISFNSVSFQCAYDLLGDNPVKQGYEYLKSLDQFVDAEDC